jgi:plasmid stabilization system protein ParE
MKVVFLASAEEDLKELRQYLRHHFDEHTWQASFSKLRQALEQIRSFPMSGVVPEELAELNLAQYRQIISGMNRIIYEVAPDMVYIHIVCDTRRNMTSLLARRLIRVHTPR